MTASSRYIVSDMVKRQSIFLRPTMMLLIFTSAPWRLRRAACRWFSVDRTVSHIGAGEIRTVPRLRSNSRLPSGPWGLTGVG
eukprot:666465-Amorphochlora_amoeboformis.AAC.1